MWGFLAIIVLIGQTLLGWRKLAKSGFGLGPINTPLLFINPLGDLAVLVMGLGMVWVSVVLLLIKYDWWIGVLACALAWPIGGLLARGLASKSIENAAHFSGRLKGRQERAVRGSSESRELDGDGEEEDEDDGEDEEYDEGQDDADDGDTPGKDPVPEDLRLVPERRDYRGLLGEPLCPICQSRMWFKGFCSSECAALGVRYGVAPHIDASRPWWASGLIQIIIGMSVIIAMALGSGLGKSCAKSVTGGTSQHSAPKVNQRR